MRRILPALLSLLLALSLAPGWAEEGPCSSCKGAGEVACSAHKALNVADLKVGDFLCADCLDLECCHGVGWNPCPKCKDPKAAAKWKAEVDRRKAECERIAKIVEGQWMDADKLRFVKERRERDSRRKNAAKREQAVPRAFLNILEGPVDHPQVYLMTDLAGNRRVTLPGQTALTPLDAHQSQHLYLARMLDVFHEVEDLHRPDAFADRKPDAARKPGPSLNLKEMAGINHCLLIFANEEAQRKVTAKLYEHETAGPMMGSPAMAWENPAHFSQDKDLHQFVFAAVAGAMLHQYNDDPGRTQEQRREDAPLPAWLDQGFTHLLEIRHSGVCEQAAVNEAKKKEKKQDVWVPKDWPKSVLAILSNKDKCRPFAELSTLLLDDMHCSDHQLAWSYVDFLLRKGMDKLAKLVPLLRKKGTNQAEALRQVYGLSQSDLETEWKAFAQKTYSR